MPLHECIVKIIAGLKMKCKSVPTFPYDTAAKKEEMQNLLDHFNQLLRIAALPSGEVFDDGAIMKFSIKELFEYSEDQNTREKRSVNLLQQKEQPKRHHMLSQL
jgi:hypothetical protein